MTPTAVDRGGSVYWEPTWSVVFCLLASLQAAFGCLTPARSSAKVNVTRDRSIVLPIVANAGKESAMSTVERAARETTAESLPEIGGATVGLTILGLAGASPVFLVEIATVFLCVGYLVRLVVKASEREPAFLRARTPDKKRRRLEE
jgi:hypothetical protein